jgi:tRNA A-37 threonylcarbamoyl transferase component Bud32
MEECRAKSVVALLDCCYAGAFMAGAKGDTAVHTTEELEHDVAEGHGHAVLAATSRTEYAWEGDHLNEMTPAPSHFTGMVIKGLRSGEADLNQDGQVSAQELYDYVCHEMLAARVKQSPQFWGKHQGQIVVARSVLSTRQIEPRLPDRYELGQAFGGRYEPRHLGGRYEVGQVLGRGGMAEVYLAQDTRLGRTVAVKTLREDLARDPSFQARFRREAQSAASLNHPAIVAVYDTGEDYIDGVSIPYIVMEYVDGSTLRELLHSERKLLPERAMEMTIGILQGLEYAHRSGIVHRDIKPADVMLTRNGQVKVMDFGMPPAMGTARYLTPEQAKGEQVDARSDLYLTGCLLYELLTVRPPFVGESPLAVVYQHVREEPQAPSVFDTEITPEMDAIVLKAMVKDPDHRYQSADEMRADIEACLDGQPLPTATVEAPFSPFWFAVPEPRPLLSETSGGRIGRLEPRQWYRAVDRRGPALLVMTGALRGLLADVSSIQRYDDS